MKRRYRVAPLRVRRVAARRLTEAEPLNRDLETDGVVARLFGRERHAEGLLVLGEFELAAVAQQFQAADLPDLVLAAESERRDDGFVLRPAHDESVQRALLGGVAYVVGREVFAVAFIEGDGRHGWWGFGDRGPSRRFRHGHDGRSGRGRGRAAGDLPGPRAVDAFAV